MKDISHCTGCGACAEICPQKAIVMKPNEDGFLYPVIDYNKCSNCGVCHKICEKYDSTQKTEPMESYSAYAIPASQRAGGSSGGVFGVIADRVMSENGVVFGAVFSPAEKRVLHTSTQKTSLESLKRSKYVQSDISHTFSEAKKLLKKGTKVLYVGTPCQIMGLKSYLGKHYSNLLTIDFMCHGVPSPRLFYDSLCQYERRMGCKIVDFTFREKNLGWRKQSVNIYFEDGRKIEMKSVDYYYYYFLRNYTLRKSCFSCELYKKHMADITVADYWTVPKEKDDDKGISLVFINSEKGKSIFDSVKDNFYFEQYCENNLERFSHKNYVMKSRESFFEYYRKNKGKKTIKKYTSKMKREKLAKKLKAPVRMVVCVLSSVKNFVFKRGNKSGS